MADSLRDLTLLDPTVTFLNHGSFGACSRPVFEEYQRWQLELERQPVEFLGRRHPDLMRVARESLADYLHTEPDNLVYVTNATWGVNAVVRSLALEEGDEVLTTDHEYGACTMTWEWELAKRGAKLVRATIPTPVTTQEAAADALWAGVTPQTRVIFLSHITSPTALTFPVAEICRRARQEGILTVIDGAHAPGQIPLDLEAIGADVYTGNLHKWLGAPKGAAFLYVRPEEQEWIESVIVSWGWGSTGEIVETTFVERNEWQGTRDLAPFLTVPAAIEFQKHHDWDAVRASCHELARETRQRVADLTGLAPICPDSPEWFTQMIACPVPVDDWTGFKTRMYDEFRIEAPMVRWKDQTFIRISYQGYNDRSDLEQLMTALETMLG